LSRPIPSFRRFVFLAAVAVLALSLVPAALAGKGKGGGGSAGTGTIGLVLLTQTPDRLPHWSNLVTFNVTTTVSQPWVHLVCKQGSKLVAEGWAGYFDGALGGRTFELDSPTWTGGAADCMASLTTSQFSVVASTSFHVDA